MDVIGFFSSSAGRWARAVVGVALIIIGALLGAWWWLLAAVGVVFVLVGVFDVCLLAPLFGKPLSGKEFRRSQGR